VTHPPKGGWGGGYSGLKMTGMIEGFFWISKTRFWEFLGLEIWQVLFFVARFK